MPLLRRSVDRLSNLGTADVFYFSSYTVLASLLFRLIDRPSYTALIAACRAEAWDMTAHLRNARLCRDLLKEEDDACSWIPFPCRCISALQRKNLIMAIKKTSLKNAPPTGAIVKYTSCGLKLTSRPNSLKPNVNILMTFPILNFPISAI